MKKNLLLITASAFAVMLFTGCSGKTSLLGIGQDSGDCEGVVSKMGVCGSPIDIYKNRDKIKKIKNLPSEGGEIYSVDNNGIIYVSEDEGETKKPVDFNSNKYRKYKDAGISQSTINGNTNKYSSNFVDKSLSKNRNVLGDDLVAVYKKQGSLLKQHKSKNYVIRDYGLVQKIWMAPYEDKDKDLHTSQTIYVVVKEPKWNVGEAKPKKVNKMKYKQTPISEKVFESQQVNIGNDRESVLENFNDNKERETVESINQLDSKVNAKIKSNLSEMDKFLNEGK